MITSVGTYRQAQVGGMGGEGGGEGQIGGPMSVLELPTQAPADDAINKDSMGNIYGEHWFGNQIFSWSYVNHLPIRF